MSNKKDRQVIIIGAGGHACTIYEILTRNKDESCEVIGFVDENSSLQDTTVMGKPVFGGDSSLPELRKKGVDRIVIGFGGVKKREKKKQLFYRTLKEGFEPLNVVHNTAYLAPSAELNRGLQILAGGIVNTGARIGENVLINSDAVVEHDCLIGSHVEIASGAVMGGEVTIKEGAYIGLGATLKQGIRIGENSIVGMGAVVLSDVPAEEVVAGVPARPLKGKNENNG